MLTREVALGVVSGDAEGAIDGRLAYPFVLVGAEMLRRLNT